MAEPTWRIDRVVAEELAAALGWSPADGVVRLARLVPERLPAGSTAKRAAVAAGRVPPGADADELARRILGHLTTADGPGGVRQSPSWTCWVATTVMAALIDTFDIGRPRVAALRRIDDRAPVVDLHSAITVVVDGATWVCDPYFGAAVELGRPAEAGEPAGDHGPAGDADADADADVDVASGAGRDDGTADGVGAGVGATSGGVEWPGADGDAPSWAAATFEPGGRWTFAVRLRTSGQGLRYRMLAPSLDRGDVHSLCAVSVQHSGAPRRPYARLHRADGIDTVRVGDDGEAHLSRWSWSVPGEAPTEQTSTHPTWSDAVAAFAGATGVRII